MEIIWRGDGVNSIFLKKIRQIQLTPPKLGIFSDTTP